MLKIEVNDMKDRFDVHIEVFGTPDLIAHQLHSVLCEIHKKSPEVIELMYELANEEVE